jgi:hypothetical protein
MILPIVTSLICGVYLQVAYLLHLRADELNNLAHIRGGARLGRRNSKERQKMEGHDMLYADYFADHATATRNGAGLG